MIAWQILGHASVLLGDAEDFVFRTGQSHVLSVSPGVYTRLGSPVRIVGWFLDTTDRTVLDSPFMLRQRQAGPFGGNVWQIVAAVKLRDCSLCVAIRSLQHPVLRVWPMSSKPRGSPHSPLQPAPCWCNPATWPNPRAKHVTLAVQDLSEVHGIRK